ncbi:MAG: adenylyl-sulfate reductase, partial [Geminicoccaceae bacterium]
MLTSNPFAELSASVSPGVMKTYVVVMILLVVGGTLFDIWHKKSAKYFFNNWQKSKDKGTKDVSMASAAIQTAASEVLTSSEFCNPKRRIAHLLTMYGFIAYA